MPSQQDVFLALTAGVVDQRKLQSVFVWLTELVNAGAFAVFRGSPRPTGLLNRDRIAGEFVIAPDLSLGLGSDDVKCPVGIDRPDGGERVGPCAGQRSSTSPGCGRAGTQQGD